MAEGGREDDADCSGGYNEHWFIKKERAREYKCGKCLNVLRDPQQIIVCGHRVCRSCLPNEVKKCPTCDRDVRPNEVFADEAARKKVVELQMKCPSKQCKWRGTLQKFEEEHKNECPFQLVKCGNAACHDMMTKNELPVHLKHECKYRKIDCQHCGAQTTIADEQTHYKECLRIPVACPNECLLNEIPKDEVQNHVDNECERTLIHCTFKTVGCEAKVERAKLQHHEESMVCEHLSEALRTINKLGQEKEAMADEIKQLQDINNKLTDEVRDLSEREDTRADKILSDLNEFKEKGSAKLDEIEKATEKKFESLAQVVQRSGDLQNALSYIHDQLAILKNTTIPELQANCVTNRTNNKKLIEKMIAAVYTKLSTALASLRHEVNYKLDTLSTAHQDECIKRMEYEAETAEEILQLKTDISMNASGLGKLNMALTITEDEMKEKFQDHSKQMQLDYDNLSHLVTKEKRSRENDFEHLRERITDLQLNSTSTGMLLWRVDNVELALSKASTKPKNVRYGKAFYSEPYGYVLQPKIFFNGARQNDQGFVAIFIKILKGEFDPILKWPFERSIRLTLIEQESEGFKRDLQKVIIPTANDELRRPTEEANNSIGIFRFVPHEVLREGRYVVDDVMYIKIEILRNIERKGHSETT